MDKTIPVDSVAKIKYGEAGWIASSALPRDMAQSHRLHEPTSMINNIDPITGHDVMNVKGHPFVVDGIMTIYFESEATKQAYLDTPFNHPFSHLPGTPSDDDDRGG